MTTPTLDELEAIARAASVNHASGRWSFPLRGGGWIWGESRKGGATHIADVRGWGYLTGHGHGALGLSEAAGIAAQDAIGAHIAAFCPERALDLIARIRELEALFDLRWEADRRGCKLWQEKTGEAFTWPDHAELVVFLLERIRELEAAR